MGQNGGTRVGSVAWGKQSRGRRRNVASASGVGSLIMRQVRAQLFAYLVLGLHNVVLHAQAEVHAQVARRLARGERALLDRHEIFARARPSSETTDAGGAQKVSYCFDLLGHLALVGLWEQSKRAGSPRKETHLRAEDRLRGPEPKPRAKPANSLQLPLFDSFEHKYSHDITARGGARESLSG